MPACNADKDSENKLELALDDLPAGAGAQQGLENTGAAPAPQRTSWSPPPDHGRDLQQPTEDSAAALVARTGIVSVQAIADRVPSGGSQAPSDDQDGKGAEEECDDDSLGMLEGLEDLLTSAPEPDTRTSPVDTPLQANTTASATTATVEEASNEAAESGSGAVSKQTLAAAVHAPSLPTHHVSGSDPVEALLQEAEETERALLTGAAFACRILVSLAGTIQVVGCCACTTSLACSRPFPCASFTYAPTQAVSSSWG
jgi:hypothetical protein